MRYVDDFVIIHRSKGQLEQWKKEIESFLKEKLQIDLHADKSRVIPLSRGVDFVGFRNFAHFRLLRRRNIKKMIRKIRMFKDGKMDFRPLMESYQGWQAYARWANTYRLRKNLARTLVDIIWNKVE